MLACLRPCRAVCSTAGPSGACLAAGTRAAPLRRALPPLAPALPPSARGARALHASAAAPSGSNKWSKIRHKKAANDSARGSFYGALSREILACVRQHPTRSADPATNSRLGLLLRKARDMDVPKDKVQATLDKASRADGPDDKTLTFEALGPAPQGGTQPVAMIIECATDSPARTHAKVKEHFNRAGARLSSTSHLFERTGIIHLTPAEGAGFDDVFEEAVEAGAEDVRTYEDEHGEGIEVICSPSALPELAAALGARHAVHSAASVLIPSGPPLRFRAAPVDGEPAEEADDAEEEASGYVDEEDIERLDRLMEALEEEADCQRIWSNLDGWPAR